MDAKRAVPTVPGSAFGVSHSGSRGHEPDIPCTDALVRSRRIAALHLSFQEIRQGAEPYVGMLIYIHVGAVQDRGPHVVDKGERAHLPFLTKRQRASH